MARQLRKVDAICGRNRRAEFDTVDFRRRLATSVLQDSTGFTREMSCLTGFSERLRQVRFAGAGDPHDSERLPASVPSPLNG